MGYVGTFNKFHLELEPNVLALWPMRSVSAHMQETKGE